MKAIVTPSNVVIKIGVLASGEIRMHVKDGSMPHEPGLSFELDVATAVKLSETLDDAALQSEIAD